MHLTAGPVHNFQKAVGKGFLSTKIWLDTSKYLSFALTRFSDVFRYYIITCPYISF